MIKLNSIKNIDVKIFQTVLIFTLFTISFDPASAARKKKTSAPTIVKDGSLKLLNVTPTEGAGAFSLTVKMSVQGENGVDYTEGDEFSGDQNKKHLKFDGIEMYDYIKVTPNVSFSISPKNGGFVLVGNFKPNTSYKVTILPGLRTVGGVSNSAEQNFEVKTTHFRPSFNFKTKARYMPQSLEGSLSWEAINLDGVKINVRKVHPQNIHHWLSVNEFTNEFVSEVVKTTTLKIKNKKNEKASGHFSLANFEPLGKGVFVIEAIKLKKRSDPSDQNSESGNEMTGEDGSPEASTEIGEDGAPVYDYARKLDTATLVITNITVIAKLGSQGTLKVWTVSTNSLQPMKDTQVELMSISNKKLDSCTTAGSNAECTLKWKENSNNIPYSIIVKSGKDLTYARVADLTLPNDRLHAGKRDYVTNSGEIEGFLYSERDLYRPGETAQLSVMVRNSKYEVVPKLPIRWTITSPRGKVVKEAVTESSEMGLAKLEFPTNSASDTGKYTVIALNGKKILHETGFLVEEFVPERIGIKLTPNKEFFLNSKDVDFALNANYLFGPPVANGKFKTTCSMKPAFSRIPNNPDYSTGLYSKEEKKLIPLDAREGTLDEKGVSKVSCNVGEKPTKLSEVYEVRIRADVSESGSGRVSTKTSSAYLTSTEDILGLKLKGKKDRQITVTGGLFNFKGEIKNTFTGQVKLKLFRIVTNWYYTYEGYGNNWKVEEIVSPTGIEKTVSVADGKFEATLNAPEGWGEWLVRAVDAKSGYVADLNTGHLGWWYSERQSTGNKLRAPDPDQLKINLSKTEVTPGEKIKVMFDAPFRGRVVLSTETSNIIESKWIDIDKPGAVETEIKIPENLPNVYITALLLKTPTEPGSKRFIPGRAWGAASVQVIPEQHRLEVKLKHPDIIESQKSVKIQISNTKQIPVEYSLAIVDEGILQMTNFKSPDPITRFFESRRLGVSTFETLGWTVAISESGKQVGGDVGNKKGDNSMPVKLVSYWYPNIKSDSSGKAEVEIKIPNFQGKLRLMAVASGKNRFGGFADFMTVRDPLVLQPTLPRFLTQGDQFHFPVTITNTSGTEQQVNINVKVNSLVSLTTTKQSLGITNNQQKTATFVADVKGVVGTAKFEIEASSADGKLQSKETFNLPVRPSGIEETLRLSFDSKKEVNLAEHIPYNWRQDYMAVDATVSNMPYLSQLTYLDNLLQYPYGCLEQTTSATLPLLGIGDLLKWIDSKKAADVDIKDLVNRGISRVMAMQTGSGGFSYWPGSNEPNPWGTAYATFMLLEAKKLGYAVPDATTKSALSYLQNWVRTSNTDAFHGYQEVRPLVLYTLAKGGIGVTQEIRETVRSGKYGLVSAMANNYNGQFAENFFLLASAAKITNDTESLKLLNNEPMFSIQVVGKRDHAYTYWSPLRSDGMRLAILEDLWPQHSASEQLAKRIATELGKKSSFYTTQDISWGVLALSKRVRGIKKFDKKEYEKIGMNINGKLAKANYIVDDAPVFRFEGPVLPTKLAPVGVPAERGSFTYLTLRGYSTTPPIGSTGQLSIRRKFFKTDLSDVDTSKVLQGDTIVVDLEIKNNSNSELNNIAIVDRLPAGFEIENPRLQRGEESSSLGDEFKPDYQDIRDDRMQVFGKLAGNETKHIYYVVRAVTRGKYIAPPAFIEAMYDPQIFSYDKETPIQIINAK